jgi:hypothetical protein
MSAASNASGSGLGGNVGIGGSMDLSMQVRKESGLAITDSIGLGASSNGGFLGKYFISFYFIPIFYI